MDTIIERLKNKTRWKKKFEQVNAFRWQITFPFDLVPTVFDWSEICRLDRSPSQTCWWTRLTACSVSWHNSLPEVCVRRSGSCFHVVFARLWPSICTPQNTSFVWLVLLFTYGVWPLISDDSSGAQRGCRCGSPSASAFDTSLFSSVYRWTVSSVRPLYSWRRRTVWSQSAVCNCAIVAADLSVDPRGKLYCSQIVLLYSIAQETYRPHSHC